MSHAAAFPPFTFNFGRNRRTVEQAAPAEDCPIVVHCHLSWDNVWQRPQQFMSRLARQHPVLFVETHFADIPEARCEHGPAKGASGVDQLKVFIPSAIWTDGDQVDRERRRIVKAALAEPALAKYRRPIQWFYDPMAVVAFAGHLDERITVYDCMDQLSQFRGAPLEIVERERILLRNADVVFCGGQKLHRQKSRSHRNCHFYGCGVDTEHFAKARSEEEQIPADIRDLPRPIFGYYGVIDERIDYALLDSLAQRTKGSVVMIGPLAKVHESELPQRPNLHWLGRRDYAELPAYAKGFDICMMPFAMNESTEFINPTKALEYLAAGRPVVSTPVPDVVALFSDVVCVASTPDQFIACCEREAALASPERIAAGVRRAEANTWERIVGALDGHVRVALAKPRARVRILEAVRAYA